MKTNPALAPLARCLGTWTVTGQHPYLPGRNLRGRVTFEPIEGGAFVRMHSKMEDAEIPEGVAIFGTEGDEPCGTMLYFDVRGVARTYQLVFDAEGFTWLRDSPEFAQRFRVTIAADGNAMNGEGSMKKRGQDWERDLCLSYVRADERAGL